MRERCTYAGNLNAELNTPYMFKNSQALTTRRSSTCTALHTVHQGGCWG